jgi:chromosomal replication initiator protein
MNPGLVWSACLGELQLQMTQATFDTWLRGAKLRRFEDGVFVVAVRNGYAKDWLESQLQAVVKRTLDRLTKRDVNVRFVVWQEPREPVQPVRLLDGIEPPSSRPQPSYWTTTLNPHYTFDRFVVGPGNRLAHAASMAAADNPATAYNPLFIHGGVGLGKTHLLHAIGQACQAQALRVLYISSEEFTNDLIESIRARTTDSFREKYRTTDVLLVDDVQFIAGKESTQEEFFHTFNALHGTGKQIVLSSDRPPRAMVTLEERLCSRFAWGLIADIQPPELETRIAILRSRAEASGVVVPDGILATIARRHPHNIRELEGAFNRVVAMSQLAQQPLTVKAAESAMDQMQPERGKLTEKEILEMVADHFGVQVSAFEGKSRSRSIARPRQVAMYLLREETGASLPHIGAVLGGRDHTTVLHGCERIAAMIEEDPDMRREVVSLRQRLYAPAG